ncbi:helix-turn-helix domain-containing protein [Paenibacillus flagellatus]|uniref:AraC family transcriptional regulator n=1 Tax=Paenibacillus flagellatus TaxID=2211139 RepID=A0A2V5KXK7_9BACL|nr:AraC family transcriptional regulator [Paenibacillus flagellatus]PYI54586.1 AraC family transcriptional regulator [Paenibacillus flagellatus]
MFRFDPDRALSLLDAYALRPGDSRLGFAVHYWGITPRHYDNPVHKHSFYEICYVLDGTGSYMDDGHWHPLGPGTLFCSRPGVLHQIRSEAGMYLLFVAFEVDERVSDPGAVRTYRSLRATDRIVLPDADTVSAALLWRSLMLMLERPPGLRESALAGTAFALLLSFRDAFRASDEDEGGDPGDVPLRKSAHQLLNRALVFIKDNLSQPLALETVARYLHVSGRHLSRLFARELGLSYVHYVRRERIRHATELLDYTDMTVQQVADAAGFASVHYFTRVFARETGCPPGKYRQRGRSGGDGDGAAAPLPVRRERV